MAGECLLDLVFFCFVLSSCRWSICGRTSASPLDTRIATMTSAVLCKRGRAGSAACRRYTEIILLLWVGWGRMREAAPPHQALKAFIYTGHRKRAQMPPPPPTRGAILMEKHGGVSATSTWMIQSAEKQKSVDLHEWVHITAHRMQLTPLTLRQPTAEAASA